MIIKLGDAGSIDLNNLNSLKNKTIENKFLAFLEKTSIVGNGDGILTESEIEKIKSLLKSTAGNDNKIIQSELNDLKNQNKSIFQNYDSSSMMNDLINLAKSINTPKFKVKTGDTVDSIIKELGYTGDDAKKYKTAFIQQLKSEGAFMNDRNWLRAGAVINLLSDDKLKELGIEKQSNPTGTQNKSNSHSEEISSEYIEVLSGDTVSKIVARLGYKGKEAELYQQEFIKQLKADNAFINDKNWLRAGSKIRLLSEEKVKELKLSEPLNTTPNKKKTSVRNQTLTDQKAPIVKTETVEIPNITEETVLESIKNKNHVGKVVDITELTPTQQKYINKYKTFLNVEPVLIKDETNGDVHILYSEIGKDSGLLTLQTVISKNCTKSTRIYSTGKIAEDYEYSDPSKNKSILLQKPIQEAKTETKIMTAIPIEIEINMSKFGHLSRAQKKQLLAFRDALISEKENLMKKLNIDNDTYNRYAQLALCIANQETKFGACNSAKLENLILNSAEDTVAIVNRATGMRIGDSTSASVGLTQIKIRDKYDNPRLAPILKEYEVDMTHPTAKQSAVATIAVLAEMEKRECINKNVIDGVEASEGRFYDKYVHKDDDGNYVYGTLRDGVKQNTFSKDDVLMYVYNGSPGQLKKGIATPAIRSYNQNIDLYKSYFTVKEDENARTEALKTAETITIQPQSKKRKTMQQDLSWGIGQVCFGSNLYKGGVSKNIENELELIKNYLDIKNYDTEIVNQFLSKVENGDITFLYGLTKEEISSLEEADIKLLIKYSDELNNKLKNITNPAQKRKIASNIDKEFKSEYLAIHAQQYYISEVEANSIVTLNDKNKDIKKYPENGYNTEAQKRCNRYLEQLRNGKTPDSGLWAYEKRRNDGLYIGFDVEKDMGINYNNARDIDILLAQNAADAANTLKTSGACLTGTKQALIGSGAVSVEEMKTFNNAFQLAKFCESHPDRFEEVKFIQISDNVVREITAGDIDNLPAGYIVVYGNKSRVDLPGHAAITNGNGQLYADEIDNANWDNFAARAKNQNGKGEHGYVRIFRLKDNV